MSDDPRSVAVAALSALTAVALAVTGETTVLAFAVPAAVVVGAALSRAGRRPGRAFEAGFQVLALVFLALFVVALGRLRLLAGAVTLTVVVQVYYLVRPATHGTLNRLLLVSFFQLVALAASTTRILFLPALLAWLALAPAAVVLGSLEAAQGGGDAGRRPLPWPPGLRRAALRATALLFVLGLAGFFAFPRYEAGVGRALGDGRGGLATSGFTDEVRLGDIGRILESDAIVFRATVEGGEDGAPLWRGLALESFTGRGWRVAERHRQVAWQAAVRLRRSLPGPTIEQEVRLEPRAPRVIFHLPGLTRVESDDFRGYEVDPRLNVWGRSPGGRRPSYRAESQPGQQRLVELDADDRARLTELPGLDPRIGALAAELAGDAVGDAARARRIAAALRARWSYSLAVQDRGVADPVARFLLERTPGHCEYFATGLAILLRTQGVPARVVTGFRGGSPARFAKGLVVRQRDAHAWVEAWLPGEGWATLDPTPAAPEHSARGSRELLSDAWRWAQLTWDDNVIGFNVTHQLGFLGTLGDWLRAAGRSLQRGAWLPVVAVGAAAAAWIATRRRRVALASAGGPAARTLQRALRLLARRGFRRAPGQTPAELAAALARVAPEAGAAAADLARLYNGARFGGRPWEPERAAALLDRLAATVPRRGSVPFSGPLAGPRSGQEGV